MALAWPDFDQDEDEWWLALLSEPLSPPLGILERVTAARPAWHAQAACKAHPELDWFVRADADATLAVCATCPVRAPCAEAGRREPFGVWGGQAHALTVRARCSSCGERPADVENVCRRCYGLARRRSQGVKPKRRQWGCPPLRPGRPHPEATLPFPRVEGAGAGLGAHGQGLCKVCHAVCDDCGEEKRIVARGLCQRCYSRQNNRRRRARAEGAEGSRGGQVGGTRP